MNIQQEVGLKVHHRLGKGAYGTVYYCTKPPNNDAYALKIFNKKDFTKSKLHYFRKEAEILASIKHPNIVQFHSFQQTYNCLYLLMQYIPGGTLKNAMSQKWQNREKFLDQQVAGAMKAILQGIKYLHKYNIIHRDLKPDNILLSDPGDLKSLKIVDFGLSAQLDANYPKNVKAQCGTLLYMAPEILYQPSYSKAVDIWSCAIIMYQLYVGGEHPIHQKGMKSDQFKQKLKFSEFPQLPNKLAQSFIDKLSRRDYTQRYSVNQALKHPWITRSEYDEIPLSVNQSIHSFTINHSISDALKFCYNLKKIVRGPKTEKIPSQYYRKVHNFTETHQQYKSRSPSMKKMRSKKKQSHLCNRQIKIPEKIDEFQDSNIDIEVSSPLIRKHERLYIKFFDKPKSRREYRSSKNGFLDKEEETCSIDNEKDKLQLNLLNLDSLNQDQESQSSPQQSQQAIDCQRNYKQNNNQAFAIQIIPMKPEQPSENKQTKVQNPKISKSNLSMALMNDRIQTRKKNSMQYRTLKTSKTKRSSYKHDNWNLKQPLSATRKIKTVEKAQPFSKTQNILNNKKPMTFGMGGVSYL